MGMWVGWRGWIKTLHTQAVVVPSLEFVKLMNVTGLWVGLLEKIGSVHKCWPRAGQVRIFPWVPSL